MLVCTLPVSRLTPCIASVPYETTVLFSTQGLKVKTFLSFQTANFLTLQILQERLQVPEMLLEQIRSLNHLDLELYKYAQEIFEKRHKHTMEKLVTAVSLCPVLHLEVRTHVLLGGVCYTILWHLYLFQLVNYTPSQFIPLLNWAWKLKE